MLIMLLVELAEDSPSRMTWPHQRCNGELAINLLDMDRLETRFGGNSLITAAPRVFWYTNQSTDAPLMSAEEISRHDVVVSRRLTLRGVLCNCQGQGGLMGCLTPSSLDASLSHTLQPNDDNMTILRPRYVYYHESAMEMNNGLGMSFTLLIWAC